MERLCFLVPSGTVVLEYRKKQGPLGQMYAFPRPVICCNTPPCINPSNQDRLTANHSSAKINTCAEAPLPGPRLQVSCY